MIIFGYDDIIVTNKKDSMVVPYPNMYSKELYGFDINIYEKKYGKFPINYADIDNDDFLYLNGRSISINLNSDLYSFKNDTIDNLIQKNEIFVYSILIWNNTLFNEKIKLVIPEKIKQQIKIGKCKFAMFYITEPWFMYQHCYEWVSEFAKNNELTKDNFVFVSSNLKANEMKEMYVTQNIIPNNFTIIPFNYFFHRLWFFTHKMHLDYSKKFYDEAFLENLEKQRITKKEKHFLCFNRKPHDHRVFIFAEIMTNPKLKDKTILTLGNKNIIPGQDFTEAIRRFVNPNYKFSSDRLYDFIDNYDANNDHTYDIDTFVIEQSNKINLDAHFKTFCNIVTETNAGQDTLFFSEKIIKPIFTLQPFIIIGNKGSLKKLKEYGFKTFSQWWDESYDKLDYQTRTEKIVEVLEEISTWDDNKINRTLDEMQETLEHNFKMILEDKSTKDFFNSFTSFIYPKNKLI
jgi:hypothetical protein